MFKSVRIWPVLAATVLVALLFHAASAQSSLFNIPTSDVVGRDQIYLEADFDSHFDHYGKGGWQSYGFLGVYGTGKRTEVGLNGYFVRGANGLEPFELQPNFKFQAYNSESKGLAVAFGTVAYLPLTKRFAKDAMASVYGVASKKFKHDWSPKVTGGAYQLVGVKADAGSKRGFLFGIEQPVLKRVTFVADWNTGKNRFGYAAAGVGLALTKHSYLWSAYYFGNQGRANNSLGIYYGYSF
jgi:hypothetical protein